MGLELNEIKRLVKESQQKQLISKAVEHQNRIAFHTVAEVDKKPTNPYYKKFLKNVSEILPQDKFDRFCQLLETPFNTIGLTNDVLTNYKRIFEAQNPFFNYDFSNPDDKIDFSNYLSSEIKDFHFFKRKAFENLKGGINSILVVDLPPVQESLKPEPYYYFVDISCVKHVKTNSKGEITSLIFEKGDKIYVYDDEFYRVLVKHDDMISEVLENPHDLGYCPASFFWSENLEKENNILKKSPFTDQLGELDKFLKFSTFKEHADLYSSFPIVVSVEEDCGYEGCQEGFIKKEERFYDEHLQDYRYEERQIKCPSCEGRKLIGAGTNFSIPVNENGQMIQNPVQIINADVTPLQYLKGKLDDIKKEMYGDLIGFGSDSINKEAVNEMQMQGSFENRLNILLNIKSQFERLHKFANTTIAKLRYGNSFISATVFYGDEFFLKSITHIQNQYKQAKEDGAPDEELQAIYEEYLQYKYRGNYEQLQRAKILLNLNPEPHKTVEQCKILLDNGAISKEDYVIKARFNPYISRFEREQTNIVNFASNLEFDAKINKISEELKKYANEIITNQ